MERIYNKLVRDNIPQIIEGKGETPIIEILDEDRYKIELEKKLLEEYKEVIEASGSDRVEELADMLEVIRSLAELEDCTLDGIIATANEKIQKRGGFSKRIYLHKVIENNTNK